MAIRSKKSANAARRGGVDEPAAVRPAGPTLVLGLAGLLIGAGVLAYANSFDGVFLFDDMHVIVRNTRLHAPDQLAEVVWRNQRPLVMLSLGLNHRMSGLDPWGYHCFNLAVHLLAGLTLFGLIRRTLLLPICRQRYLYSAVWLAFAAALLWTLHPLQTQAVTYVIQRAESMMGLCYLLTLYCWVRGARPAAEETAGQIEGRRQQGWVWLVSAVLACLFGMGCKSVMITAPLAVLLYDRIFLSADFAQLIRRRGAAFVGLFATIGLLCSMGVVRHVLLPGANSKSTVGFGLAEVSWWQYLRTQPGVLLHYLSLAFWPQSLCLDYVWPVAVHPRSIFGPGLVIVGLLALTVWGLIRRPALGFLGAGFFLVLSPTSSVIPIADMAFEHRMYLPLAAIVTLVVIVAHHGLVLGLRLRPLAVGMAAVAAGLLGYRTHLRNRDYHDMTAMWESIVAARPGNVRAMTNLALEWVRMGRMDEAIKQLREAVRLKDDFPDAHQALGDALARTGQIESAIQHFQRAVEQDPRSDKAHLNLGIALARVNRVDEAIVQYREALQLNPTHHEALNSLGLALIEMKRNAEAMEMFNRAIELEPSYDKAYNNRGIARQAMGRMDEAMADFRRAAELNASDAASRRNLGVCLSKSGKMTEGLAFLERAAELEPTHVDGRLALGQVCESLGRIDQAREQYEAILRMSPGQEAARSRLRSLVGSRGTGSN